MTDFLHPLPSSSKGPPQWRPLFKRAPTTVHQAPVMTPKSKSEELTMALQRPWLKFDMARKPSDQSQNDYVPEIFVACKIVPSFEDFFKECSTELEHILKKRPTVSPKIKINVENANKGETITLYNTKGEAHTTTVQSGSALTTLGQLDNDQVAELNVTASTNVTRKFTNVRSKRKVRNVPRILANSKRRFNDLPKNLRMLYRRYKIKDCFVFMYKVPYRDSFSLTSPVSYKATISTENQERLNDESKEDNHNNNNGIITTPNNVIKLYKDIYPINEKTESKENPELENRSMMTGDFKQAIEKDKRRPPEENSNLKPTEENSNLQQPEEEKNLEQRGGNGNQLSSNSHSIGNLNKREILSMPELDLVSSSPSKEMTTTRKSPPRINLYPPALSITPTLVGVDSTRSSKNGSHLETIKHTVDYLINQNSKESCSTNIDGNRSISPNKFLSSTSIQIFRKSQDKDTTMGRDKNSPSPKQLEHSVQFPHENRRSPSSEVSLTRNQIKAASDTKSCSPKPGSSNPLRSSTNELKEPPENRVPHDEKLKVNQIFRRHSFDHEDRVRTSSPSSSFQQGAGKRVKSKSREDRRHSTETCRVKTSDGLPLISESICSFQDKKAVYPAAENCVAIQPSTTKNCDKPSTEAMRTTWPTDHPVNIKEEPKDDADTSEPPTKKPKCDDTYLWWMARRVKKEHVNTELDLKYVTFNIYSCFRCHKEFSEHKHWSNHSCVPETS